MQQKISHSSRLHWSSKSKNSRVLRRFKLKQPKSNERFPHIYQPISFTSCFFSLQANFVQVTTLIELAYCVHPHFPHCLKPQLYLNSNFHLLVEFLLSNFLCCRCNSFLWMLILASACGLVAATSFYVFHNSQNCLLRFLSSLFPLEVHLPRYTNKKLLAWESFQTRKMNKNHGYNPVRKTFAMHH